MVCAVRPGEELRHVKVAHSNALQYLAVAGRAAWVAQWKSLQGVITLLRAEWREYGHTLLSIWPRIWIKQHAVLNEI